VTRPLTVGLGLFLLYALVVLAAAAAAGLLRRPIPRGWLIALVLPPILLLAPGFLRGRTMLPAAQAVLTLPAPGAPPGNVWHNDAVRQFAPWAEAVKSSWKRLEIPHRSRWTGCGTPLAANGQSAAYSPLTLLGLLLPLPAAFTFWAAARLFLCLAGTWLWLTELGVSRRGALFGAISFGLSMSMTAWLLFPHSAALSFWPWVLWGIELLRDRALFRRALALLALVLALWPLSGHVETVASASAGTLLWLLARWALGDRAGAARMAAGGAAAALLALGLSAFALLPQALAILESNRLVLMERPFWSAILSLAPHGPRWPLGAAALLLPRLFGDKLSTPTIPGAAGAFPEVALPYFGIVGAALAACVLRPGSFRPAAERALVLPLAFGVGAATGFWPFAEIASNLPALGHMFPLRYLSWAALAGSALAAFELDRLVRDLETRRGTSLWLLGAMAALVAAGALLYGRLRPLYEASGALPGQRNAYLLPAVALAAAALVVLATGRNARRFAAIGAPLLTLIAAGELFRQGDRLNRWSDPADLYPATPLVGFLRSRPAPFRVAGEGASLFPNVGILARVADVRTHDPVERRDYVEFLDATCGYDPNPYFKQLANLDAAALDALNVRYLVALPGSKPPGEKWRPAYSGPDGAVFENARALPPAWAPESVRVVRRAAPGRLLEPAQKAYGASYPELFAGLDWRREAVVLEDGRNGFRPAAGKADISDWVESDNRAAFAVRTAHGGGPALVVTSLVEDGGWRARDENGNAIPTGRANGPFLALMLPEGERRVRLEYAAPGFRTGRTISVVSLGIAGLLAAAATLGSRRRVG
jgi:hypothetical protein